MSEAEKVDTLRLEETSIPSLTLKLPKGFDLRVEFVDVGDSKDQEVPLALRSNSNGDLELDCVNRNDAAGCRTTVPPPFPNPARADLAGCKGPIRNKTCKPPDPPPKNATCP